MDEPLGYAIGNSLEVIESINTLKGNGPKDLTNLVIELASYMISMAKNITVEQAKQEVIENLNNGKAYNKFVELVENQEGNINDIKVSNNILSIKSNEEGYIKHIDALRLGENARIIGAGRLSKEESIDFEVGIVLNKKVGDYINKGEELLKVYIDNKTLSEEEFIKCFEITKEKIEENTLIKEIIV